MLLLNEKNSNEVLGFLERKWGGGSRYYEDEDINNVFYFFFCVMDMNWINFFLVVLNIV